MSSSNGHVANKQGTNDTEDAAPPRTRTRVSRACTRCRARKDKCDGGTPSCSNCLNADQPCSYDQVTKKRGLPEGYVRAIEKLWAVTFTRVPGLEDSLLHMLTQDRELLMRIWNHREVGEELHTRWKDSPIFQELENFLTNLDHSAATGSKRKRDNDDEEELDVSLGLSTILPPRFSLQNTTQAGRPLPSKPAQVTPTFQLPAGASALVGHYFKFTHCWFPILDRPQTLRRCYELSRKTTQCDASNGTLAVLAAVLSYTSQQQMTANESTRLAIDSEQMAKVARSCMPKDDGIFGIDHLQALLLLSLADMTAGRWDSAWRTVGLVSRLLTLRSRSAPTSTGELTALVQGCLTMDALISAKIDQSPQRINLFGTDHLSPDGHEEWEPWPGTSEPAFVISCFNDLTRLSDALGQYFCEFQMNACRITSARTDEVLTELSNLTTNYPPASQPLNSRPGPPHQIWLKIAHLLISAFVAATQESKVDTTITYIGTAMNVLKDLEKSTTMEYNPPVWILAPAFAALRQLRSHAERNRYAPPPKHASVLRALVKHSAAVSRSASEELAAFVELIIQDRATSNASISTTRRESSSTPVLPGSSQQPRRQPFFPVDPFAQTGVMESGSNASQLPNVALGGPGFAQSPGNYMQVEWGNAIDIPTGSTNMPTGGLITGPASTGSRNDASALYNASIATSPSFQGDEIDALFHEMAQLDTTEWTSGRDQGLKDFGFDDLSFEQFCNDPDRLFSGGLINQQPLNFHNRQPSDYQMPDVFTQAPTFGYENSWNG